MPTAPSTRMSAADRREQLIAIALEHFAERGYTAASTEAIARDAGISQPYLFRLFRTKRELFLAAVDANHGRLLRTFEDAARGDGPEERLLSMGGAYIDLLKDPVALRMQMQSYTATTDPAIQAHVRRRYLELIEDVKRWSGATEAQVWDFASKGMLLNVIAVLGLEGWDHPRERLE